MGLVMWTMFQAALLGVVQPASPGTTPPPPGPQVIQPIEVVTPPIEIKVKEAGAKPAAPGAIATADDLLNALETADADLRTLTADIRYDRTFEIQGDRQVREGKLYFQSRPQGEANNRKFAISFSKLIVGPRIREAKDDPTVVKDFIFDGEWLVERLPGEKPPMFTKRQVVPPGERFDPLRIGEGPMPIPIGQRRQDILSRYDAQLMAAEADVDDDALKKFVKDAYQLKLTPRAERTDQDEFREIRLWYRPSPAAEGQGKGPLLPRMARTVNRSGDESIVQLINVQVNKPIPEQVMDTRTPGPKDGWDVQIIPFRQDLKSPGEAEPARSGGR